MNRPKYLLDVDAVQDALNDAGSEGLLMKELVAKTKLHYAAVQQASVYLRNAHRIKYEYQGRKIRFYSL